MNKLFTKIISLSVILSFFFLSGCRPYNTMTDSDILSYLENKYDREFVLVSSEEDDQIMYVRANPSVTEPLTGGKWEVCREDNDEECADSQYMVYFQGYDEIEPAVNFITDALMQIDGIPGKDYSVNDKSVISSRAGVSLKSDVFLYNLYLYLPSEDVSESYDTDAIVKKAQSEYVKQVREGLIDEKLPDYVLYEYPAGTIRNITYNGETIINYMAYSSTWNEYYTDWYCTEKDGCVFYFDKLSEILKVAGFDEKINNNSLTWTKDGREIEIKLKKINSLNEKFICLLNGEEINLDDKLIYQAGGRHILRLPESDYNRLFGITFSFDQIEETGELFIK